MLRPGTAAAPATHARTHTGARGADSQFFRLLPGGFCGLASSLHDEGLVVVLPHSAHKTLFDAPGKVRRPQNIERKRLWYARKQPSCAKLICSSIRGIMEMPRGSSLVQHIVKGNQWGDPGTGGYQRPSQLGRFCTSD